MCPDLPTPPRPLPWSSGWGSVSGKGPGQVGSQSWDLRFPAVWWASRSSSMYWAIHMCFLLFFQSRSAAPAYRTRAGAFSWRFVWPGLWDWLKYRYVRQNAPTVLIISHNQYIRVWWGLTSFSFNYFSSRSDIKTALQMMGEFTGVFTVYWRLYLIHIR